MEPKEYKEQISEYINEYSKPAMIEELAKLLAKLDKQSSKEYETDKNAYETTLKLIKYLGEKLNDEGGEELMRQVLALSGSFGCNTRFVDREWTGIGSWFG